MSRPVPTRVGVSGTKWTEADYEAAGKGRLVLRIALANPRTGWQLRAPRTAVIREALERRLGR